MGTGSSYSDAATLGTESAQKSEGVRVVSGLELGVWGHL